MDENDKKILKYLEKLEATAEDILIDREIIKHLSAQREYCREGMRALQNLKQPHAKKASTWMVFGDMFIKVSKDKAISYMKEEQKVADEEINNKRNNLKRKVDDLRELEGNSRINPGYYLNPLNKEDMNFIGSE